MTRRSRLGMALLAVLALGAAPPGDVAAAEAPEVVATAPEVQSHALEHQVQDVVINAVDLEISLEELEQMAVPEVAAVGIRTRPMALTSLATIYSTARESFNGSVVLIAHRVPKNVERIPVSQRRV